MARKKIDRPVGPVEAEFRALIPELQEWNDGRGILLVDWIGCLGSFQHAIGYVALFWPEFIVHRNCVLLADSGTEGFDEFATHGLASAQSTVNHRHIDLYFQHDPLKTEAQMVHLGRKLRAMWAAKLALEFPERAFVVAFEEDTVTLTFYEPEPSS